MTMGSEDELFNSLALPVVIKPILEKLESKDVNAVKSLRAGFNKVEAQHPGFTLNLIRGILKKAEIENQVDLSECFLRLERTNSSNEFLIDRPEDSLRLLNSRSVELKRILSRIPDEIYDRKKFLETIKEIASSIRLLLDSVNTVLVMVNEHQKHSVDYRKKEFVKYSRHFSNTLKDFFRDNDKTCVFLSANHLVNQSNILMKTIKEALL